MMIIFNIISILGILLNALFFKNTFFGVFSLVLWLFITGYSYKNILLKFFKDIKFSYLLGIFISFYVLCFFGSIFAVFYKINELFFVVSLVFTTFFPILILDKKIFFNFDLKNINFKIISKLNLKLLNIDLIILLSGILIFSILILFYLFQASSGGYNIYQFSKTFPLLWFIFFGLVLFLLIYIFNFKNKIKSIKKYFLFGLILTIFISFILHSTLPILYKSGFGGDRLRHTATEKFLQEGGIVTPSLFGLKENVVIKQIGGINIPEVLIVGNKQSYANKWIADIFLSWILNRDVIIIDKYLVFIIWSIFIPILFVNIFRIFTEKEEFLLLFSLSSCFFSPLLIQGSQSDPRSFGLLLFLFIISLFLHKIKNGDMSIKWFLLFSFISMMFLYFNYIVFLILFIIFTTFYVLFNETKIKYKIIFIPLMSFLILFLDVASGQSFLSSQNFSSVINKVGIFFGNLISLNDYTTDIYESSRNFIYFKNIINIDKLNSPWIVNFSVFFSIIILLLSIIGIVFLYKNQSKYRFLVYTFSSIFLSYFLSFILFEGVRIFAKRIEIIISIFLLIFFIYSLLFLSDKIKHKLDMEGNVNYSKKFILPIFIFCSLLVPSTLFSGPIMENATESDFKAAKWLFSQIKNDEKYCIIGNTWPLLALEYESSRKIVTGGFPQGLEFSQKERVEIFNKMIKNPSKDVLDEAKKITGANKCFFLIKNDYIKSAYFGKIKFVEIHDKYKQLLTIFKSNKDIDDVKIFIEQ